MKCLKDLLAYSMSHPLLLVCLNKPTSSSIIESRQGSGRFSFTVRHAVLDALRPPCLCLFYLDDGNSRSAHVGIAKSKKAVTTLDSAVWIAFAQEIKPSTPDILIKSLSKTIFKTRFTKELENGISVLPKRLSEDIVNVLASVEGNGALFKHLEFHLFGKENLSFHRQSQNDAIQLALKAFGLGKQAPAVQINSTDKSDSCLQFYETDCRILEANLIAHDARAVPGYDLIMSDVTGHAVFVHGSEQLDIYTANCNPLEKMLGVDLIYANMTHDSIVMVQYKMLEREGKSTDKGGIKWVYRPDKQFYAEKSRMTTLCNAGANDDYRFNSEPFYFKFAKRFLTGSQGSMLLPLEHLNLFLESDDAKGPKGGLRVSYEGLRGHYLRETEFLALLHSGYIGTHADETKFLLSLIDAVTKGKNALVYAIQQSMPEDDEHEEDDQ